jgi:hypothetical protein
VTGREHRDAQVKFAVLVHQRHASVLRDQAIGGVHAALGLEMPNQRHGDRVGQPVRLVDPAADGDGQCDLVGVRHANGLLLMEEASQIAS